MQVIGLKDLPLDIAASSVTVGSFDGFHRGHLSIIRELSVISRCVVTPTVLVTFRIPPRIVLSGDENSLLMTAEEKIEVAEKAGLDYLLLLDFTEELREMGAREFLERILLEGLKAKRIVLGFNHHFGRNREGDIHFLANHVEEMGFGLTVVPPEKIGDMVVNSSRIRKFLWDGEVERASECLGRPYSLSGKVVKGLGLGEKIGFRTANLEPDRLKLVPRDGVYAVSIELGSSSYGGVMNIGRRPTVDGHSRMLEVHIFGYEGKLYGKRIKVEFIKRLRGERKFGDLNALREQIERDIETARNVLASKGFPG